MSVKLPESHLDLLDGPIVVSLATIMADGQPQLTPVWCSRQDNVIWINTKLGRQKARNMQERPMVTILAIDPEEPLRYIEVRGQVIGRDESELAVKHINDLSLHYDGKPFRKLGEGERRCIFIVEPIRVNKAK